MALDGSSEVKIVALDGEMRYLEFKVPTKASLKPACFSVWRNSRTLGGLTLHFATIAQDDERVPEITPFADIRI